ncbi:hypothetical protein OSTOST_02922, partial [Ostertagia ostertagi]
MKKTPTIKRKWRQGFEGLEQLDLKLSKRERCYATAICNTQTGILNSTIIGEEEPAETTTRFSEQRWQSVRVLAFCMVFRTGQPEQRVPEAQQRRRRRLSPFRKITSGTGTITMPVRFYFHRKYLILDPCRFTVSQNSKVSSKYIPFWKRLLSTTITPSTPNEEIPEASLEIEVEPEIGEEAKSVVDVKEFPKEMTIPQEEITSTERPAQETNRQTEVPQVTQSFTSRERHTFKPLPMTVPPAAGPELAFQKASGRGPGFWNRFQPNRWFESIHYVTNTG